MEGRGRAWREVRRGEGMGGQGMRKLGEKRSGRKVKEGREGRGCFFFIKRSIPKTPEDII